MAEIITLGELLIDFFSTKTGVSLAESPWFIKSPGGATANVAVGASKLGKKSAFIGKVGDDPFGDFLESVLNENKVDTTQLKRSSKTHTTLAFVALRKDGGQDYCFYRNPGADTELAPEDISKDFISQGKIFHFGSLSLTANPVRAAAFKALKYAREAGLVISYDPNLRLSLWDSEERAREEIKQGLKVSDIVKVNREELSFITGENSVESGIKNMLKYGLKMIFVTQGKDRSGFARKDGRIHYVDTFKVKSVDTTGCGDAFMSAILVQLCDRTVNIHPTTSLRGASATKQSIQKDNVAVTLAQAGVALQQNNVAAELPARWQAGLAQRRDKIDDNELKNIVRYANASAAITSLKVGVIPALPERKEVEEFLEGCSGKVHFAKV